MRFKILITIFFTFSLSTTAITILPTPQLQPALPGHPTCSKIRYGFPLQPPSCQNALSKIPRSSIPKRYGLRSTASPARESFDYLVPDRYLSDDGLCAIDVVITQAQVSQGPRWDVASGIQLSDAAGAVMRWCVQYWDGGSVDRFTTNNALALTIRKYEPSVDCNPHASQVPDYQSCELALRQLPTSRYVGSFVSSDYPRPGRGVTKLPREYVDESGRYAGDCHIVYTMTASPTPTLMTYWDAWEAAVAINTMCVQHGMIGTVRDLGNDLKIQVSILPEFR